MKVLFVGGNFDDNGGRPSSMVSKFSQELSKNSNVELTLFNGGFFSEIENILNKSIENDIVIWWANIPNDKPKIRNVKAVNNKVMLVTSKRNDNNKYLFSELINRALEVKANLCIEFSKNKDKFDMMLFDPLGNCWYKGDNISDCCIEILKRLVFLKSITRQGTIKTEDRIISIVPDEIEFFEIIKDYANVFHTLINPDPNVTRFLGNSSFRCQRGFPSFKKDGIVYVSRRNVDKRFIDKNSFVPTQLIDGKVFYYGDNKPSVDTPIQLRLYNQLSKINYMIHAHVYIENAPFTTHMIPCGGIEEVDETLSTIKNNFEILDKEFYAINLIGHGCIVMSSDVEKLKNLDFVGRKMPEIL